MRSPPCQWARIPVYPSKTEERPASGCLAHDPDLPFLPDTICCEGRGHSAAGTPGALQGVRKQLARSP
jgi:hypothetical protein